MSLKTLDTSLHLLEYFTEQKSSWGVRELAKEVEMNHSVVYRILSTFEKRGFLIQNQETKKYELGLKFWVYGQMVRERNHFTDVIQPMMEDLCEKTGESIFLTGREGNKGICLHFVESTQRVKYSLQIGTKTPLYAGSSNKVIMAYLTKEKQESIMIKGLDPITDQTVTNVDRLRDDLIQIKENGWAHSIGEYSENIFGIAVPLFNYHSEILASLAIAGPEYRISEPERVSELLQYLQAAQIKIQEALNKYRVLHF
ncbi:IclR family transcriptional regulator [Risungbinella massiliensis]|uniref:IclR family transcriptional regulator n=1 Tax=Risungbinella massiliensis TaxID=1329796 RepID=UPI0005CC70E0|nr:IclR family transcriptional regulator [Risungbinella massiliensis]